MSNPNKNKRAPTPTDAILESISDGVFTVDPDWRISSFNRAAETITGVARAEAIGRLCSEVFRSSMCGPDCALRQTLATGKPVIGRTGYIIDAEGRRIPVSISTAVLRDADDRVIGGAETFRDLSEIEALRRELEGRSRVGDLVSRSPLMQRVFEALPAIAASPSTVLILGETGTGKDLVARTIHDLSPRREAPFVAVNCGALPETLLESELFGYKAGAFTGAVKDKPGRFALAGRGTLFLDEIGEISPALQVRLLRVLQERVYEPLGSTRPETTPARIIVATHRDLAQQMRKGAFREDLYYRINVVRIELPPLRRRLEDIPDLLAPLLADYKKSPSCLTPSMSDLIRSYPWPGNIRELNSLTESYLILLGHHKSDEALFFDLFEEYCDPRERSSPSPAEGRLGRLTATPAAADASMSSLAAQLEARKRQIIRETLQRCANNKTLAAKELGVSTHTLWRAIKKTQH